jgi:hypothetical protein
MQTELQSKKLDFDNPFHHPVIVSTLREEFFQKANSFGKMHLELFVSTHKTHLEPKLPEPMVVLVATAVCIFFYIMYVVELNVTGSWDGSAVRPMDRGKFCNRTSVVWIRVVSSCYTDGLVFHNDQYQAIQGCDSVVLAVVALVHVRVRLCLFTVLGST